VVIKNKDILSKKACTKLLNLHQRPIKVQQAEKNLMHVILGCNVIIKEYRASDDQMIQHGQWKAVNKWKTMILLYFS